MEKDSKYQVYANQLAKDVPDSDMAYLIALFMKEAAINMGVDNDSQTLERTIYHVKKDFRFIPMNYIGSAFIRGSLGHFGPGRLVPRTIHGWMNEISIEYNRMISNKENNRAVSHPISFDLQKYPIGSAIAKKIDWYKKGILKIEDWDRVPLKELAEREANKLESYPQMFGIE